MTSLRLRVIKLGGSLLDWQQLSARFRDWMNAQSPALNLLLVGGGEVVERFRKLDQLHHFDPQFVHWVAVDLMSLNAPLASRILSLPGIVSTRASLHAILSNPQSSEPTQLFKNKVVLIQPTAFYSRELNDPSNYPLPETWDCTSDSIAAYLAMLLGAEELVLLKSTLADGQPELVASREQFVQLADDGLVDRVFPAIAKNLAHVRIVNLRSQAS